MGQNERAIDDRIEAAIEAAGIIPEFCQWFGDGRITIEIGEVPPYRKAHVEAHWDIEQITNALREAVR